jgi:hydantoinase/carbamoylase family amidase
MEISKTEYEKYFDGLRIEKLINRFANFGKPSNRGVTRLAFSAEDLEARQNFIRILQDELSLPVRIDALGNIFARREGRFPNFPSIMTGSHLDSVQNGGKYDGPAGVFAALEVFRALDMLKIETNHPFELAVMASEEPNTFGLSTFGSRGIIGILERKALIKLTDDSGQSLSDALARIGGDLDRIKEAALKPGDIKYFVELHIEQMPNLDEKGKDIGVVQGITGIYRENFEIKGVAGHCGTTSMSKRRDALCAAAEVILEIEAAARSEEGAAVATVGRLKIFPNSINITPESVIFTAEIRSYSKESIQRIKALIDNKISTVSAQREIDIKRQVIYNNKSTVFSSKVTATIKSVAEKLGFSTMDIVSMAGHDAGHLNSIAEAGMIFIPCRNGLSHCPEEYTDPENLVKGAQCLFGTLLSLDKNPDIQ